MARLSEKHRKYMTKEQMANSIVHLYSLYKSKLIPLANLHILIDHVLWAWTEFDGKYKGCVWWSHKALEYFLKTGLTDMLTHEHVVPRDAMRKEIIQLLEENFTQKELLTFLEKHLIGCVVLNEEHGELHNYEFGYELNENTTWNRYDLAKVRRKKVSW